MNNFNSKIRELGKHLYPDVLNDADINATQEVNSFAAEQGWDISEMKIWEDGIKCDALSAEQISALEIVYLTQYETFLKAKLSD